MGIGKEEKALGMKPTSSGDSELVADGYRLVVSNRHWTGRTDGWGYVLKLFWWQPATGQSVLLLKMFARTKFPLALRLAEVWENRATYKQGKV